MVDLFLTPHIAPGVPVHDSVANYMRAVRLRYDLIVRGELRPRETFPDPPRTFVVVRRPGPFGAARLAPREHVLRLDDAGRAAARKHMREGGSAAQIWSGP